MSTLHPVQSKILTSLQTVNFSKFSRLRPTDMTSDHFNFHIKKLVDQSFIAKTETGDYFLTTRGKAYANFLDKNALGTTQKQPKISLLFIVRKKFGGEIKYVVQRRAKQPFIGHLVFPTWRVEWGKKISETASTYLTYLTGLSGSTTTIGQIRRIDKDSDTDETIYDVLFLVVLVEQPLGTLSADPIGANQMWATKEEMLSDEKLTGIPPHVFKMLEDKSHPRLIELEFNVKNEQF